MGDIIVQALFNIFEWENILAIVLGVAFGLFIGSMPGLSVTMGVALMLPLTFGLPPTSGILLLVGVYCAGTYAGSISAILINNPGTIASATTAADGFNLSKQGRAYYALNIAIYASVAGSLFSGIVLFLFAPSIANFALRFGPPEYFMLAMFGLTVVTMVSGKYLLNGLVMACLGMLIATIGLDPIEGTYRFTFNIDYLLSGIDIVPAVVGLFAVAEIFNQMEQGAKPISSDTEIKKEKFSLKNMFPFKKTIFKSSIIGVIVGIIPGTGGVIGSALSYNEAKRTSKNPESYGKGNPEGVAASESGNNGVTGATLIPMMTLGIPGDAPTAVLLGALMVQGLSPGPDLFSTNGIIAYSVITGFILVTIIMFIEAKLAIKLFAKVINIPPYFLWPIVLVLCLIGTYAVDNNMSSVVVTLFFGILGYILPKYNYPIIPILLGIVLGPIAETSLMQSLVISNGSFLIFLTRPISIVFAVLIVLSIIFSILGILRSKKIQEN